MNNRLSSLLSGLELGADKIWSSNLPSGHQEVERKFREVVAVTRHDNYLRDIAQHHSIPVMDYEVDRFLDVIPDEAIVLDVGGCWGWHWRRLQQQRPDVCVVIVDFVRPNLLHAKTVLGPLVGNQVVLVHADATSLPFPDNGVDGFWSVQAFQHIPDFQQACREAYRVLKVGGWFMNYSLHITPAVQLIYWLFGKAYHIEGMVEGSYHLNRANKKQRNFLVDIFGEKLATRYTECFFHPDLKFSFSGRNGSWIGLLDARLGNWPQLGRWLARQCSFEAIKTG